MTRRSLIGRRILLTGGSRGIGRAIAKALLAQGARLALVGRNEDALRATLDDAPGIAKPIDLAQPLDAEALVHEVADALGGLDSFVSCAGVVHYEPLLGVAPAHLSEQMRVNLLSPFALSMAAGRALSSGGDLLFVASTLGLRPVPLTAAYAASKAALISLCRSCALELGPRGIRSNVLVPGVIDTDMINVLRPGAEDVEGQDQPALLAQQKQHLAELHPLGRLGSPEEVAEAALYLLQSNFVTGSVLTVDGGLGLGA